MLAAPFQCMRHGVSVDLTPTEYGGAGTMIVDDESFPLQFDGEKLYYTIEKPTEHDLDTLQCFELTSPLTHHQTEVTARGIQLPRNRSDRRSRKKTVAEDISMGEWRKRLAWAPEDVVTKTLENTTQFYMSIEGENRENPRRHFTSRARGLRYQRQNDTVATDTISPSVKTYQGHKLVRSFIGGLKQTIGTHNP